MFGSGRGLMKSVLRVTLKSNFTCHNVIVKTHKSSMRRKIVDEIIKIHAGFSSSLKANSGMGSNDYEVFIIDIHLIAIKENIFMVRLKTVLLLMIW